MDRRYDEVFRCIDLGPGYRRRRTVSALACGSSSQACATPTDSAIYSLKKRYGHIICKQWKSRYHSGDARWDHGVFTKLR